MDLRHGIVIKAKNLAGAKTRSSSYQIVSFVACPLGNKMCHYNGTKSTFCTRGNTHGVNAVCLCAGCSIPRSGDVKDFSDVIENFAGPEILTAILHKLEKTKSSR